MDLGIAGELQGVCKKEGVCLQTEECQTYMYNMLSMQLKELTILVFQFLQRR